MFIKSITVHNIYLHLLKSIVPTTPLIRLILGANYLLIIKLVCQLKEVLTTLKTNNKDVS